MAEWRKKAQQRIKESAEGRELKLSQGDQSIRILPDKRDLLPDGRLGPKGIQHAPYREYCAHYKVGPDKATCMCGYDWDGNGKCWLCDTKIPELEKNPKKAQMARDIASKQERIYVATRFDLESRKFSKPKPFKPSAGGPNSIGNRIHSKVASMRKDYLSPDKGHNINIKATGDGLNRRYPECEGDESPTKVPAAVLAQIPDLDSLVRKYDEEDQKSRYFGRPRAEETEEEDETDEEVSAEDYDETVAEETAEEGSEEAEEADTETEESEAEEPTEEVDEDAALEAEETALAEEENGSEEEIEEFEAEAEEEEEEPLPPPPPPKKAAPKPAAKTPPPPAKKTAPPATPAKQAPPKKRAK